MSAQITFKRGNEKDIQTYLCMTFKRFVDALDFDFVESLRNDKEEHDKNFKECISCIKTYAWKFEISRHEFNPLEDVNFDNLARVIFDAQDIFKSLHTLAKHEKPEGWAVNEKYSLKFLWRLTPQVTLQDDEMFIAMRCGVIKRALLHNPDLSNEIISAHNAENKQHEETMKKSMKEMASKKDLDTAMKKDKKDDMKMMKKSCTKRGK